MTKPLSWDGSSLVFTMFTRHDVYYKMPNTLTQTTDAWTVQAVMASAHLVRLYRSLGDNKQVVNAIQACGRCEERGRRLGLLDQVGELRAATFASHTDDAQGEAKAWELLVEAQAGLVALHGLVADHAKAGSIRGSSTATQKAFQCALQGYRVAFPMEMAVEGVRRALEAAATSCAGAFTLDLDDATPGEAVEIREEVFRSVLEALLKEAGD